MAGWEIVYKNASITTYADRATISKKGNVATIWVLMDHAEIPGSNKQPNEFDCKEHKTKLPERYKMVLYDQRRGAGSGRESEVTSQSGWEPVPSNWENLFKIACGKQDR